MTSTDPKPWGRVDETGTVYLREGDGERVVGEYPDGSPEEALAYFQRKYTELAGQVTLLEQRIKRGTPPSDIAKLVSRLSDSVRNANAIGDLGALLTRLEALSGTVEVLTEKQSAESKAATSAALAERESIVLAAEQLAAEDPAKTQWKQTTAALDALFTRWQEHQQNGPKLPKGEANELWRRFRAARTTVEHNRKAFFAELDSGHRDARARKQELVDAVEALVPRGADGIPEQRRLLDQWRETGRAGKRYDDALWARFKAASDALYSAKSEIDAKENEEFSANLAAKLALLTEAEPLLAEKDRTRARNALTSIQRRWDEIGKVPREQVRPIEDRLRKVEAAVRALDEDHWQRSDPEKKARSEGLAGQLSSAIAKLESELTEARAKGDQRAIKAAEEALAARRVWLDALGG